MNIKKILKALSVLERNFIKMSSVFSTKYYMKRYVEYLKKVGVNFQGNPNFISTSVYFDGYDYSKISIGQDVTISFDVMFLTHDGSIYTVSKGLGIPDKELHDKLSLNNNLVSVKGITIGRNSFIGARSALLPGTIIGDNVLIGACSVVKGIIPDNSIVVGNPAKIIGKTSEWIDKKMIKLG
jgi:acetyltransferase-like isoleucine patch superfamily enzyme